MPETQTLSPYDVLVARFRRARQASRALSIATTKRKNAALEAIALALVQQSEAIVSANERDLSLGAENGLSMALQDRLRLDGSRIGALADAVRNVIALPDPIGQVIRGGRLPNGLRLEQVRVPLGVLGVIYEARPNVTVDIASLAIKSGNAVVLRGGSAAQNTNATLVEVLREAIASVEIDPEVIQTVDDFGREGAHEMMHARGLIDVLIPRGGHGLIQTVVAESTVPVIETGEGNVHIFLDESADAEMAAEILVNAKTQRPSVCNAVETLLVHRAAAERLLPVVLGRLREKGVVVHADEQVRAIFSDAVPATERDWETEYMSLDIAVTIVDSLDEAIAHIDRYSSRHTEAIITNDVHNAERFLAEVDAAAVMVNASTRFTDGGEFGFGAEVGISTQKLHARGPMGLPELTSTKWLVRGDGQVRA
ncbi:MAG TPA: glutamate-5-semialdehyde dehydrogenase [Pseudoclavibacter sp.]|nr:glutamate-5-semialdehyde dehydrogenase [Pseudoclavibacter sp.]